MKAQLKTPAYWQARLVQVQQALQGFTDPHEAAELRKQLTYIGKRLQKFTAK